MRSIDVGRAAIRPRCVWSATVVVVLLAACPATATNGLNLIGFGGESVAMAGADLAVARDTSAANTNPAGLTQIDGHRLDLDAATAFAVSIRHQDSLGNDDSITNRVTPFGEFGYAQRLGHLTLGVGLFAQGGAGIVYEDLINPFGAPDDFSILLRIARLTPAVAWQVSDRLSLGASTVITYADIHQEIFPERSAPAADGMRPFYGFELKDMDTLAVGVKVGAQLRPSERLTVGLAYTSPVDLDLGGGKLISNQAAEGRGKVTYRDVEAKGLNQPQEAGIGVALQATERLLIAGELTWIDWSGAVKRTSLVARDPDDPDAPPELAQHADLDWRDLYVLALGVAYDLSDRTVLRAGYNRARNPVPDRSVSPILAPVARHHLTAGAGFQLTDQWRADTALEYQLRETTTYTNPDLPFGPDAQEQLETLAIHLMVSRAW